VLKLLGIAALVAAGPAAIDTPAPIAPVISVGQSATAAPAMAASVAVLTPAQAKAAKANEVVCKSNLETGSLVKQPKQCLTRKQWAYVNDQHEGFARKMVQDNAGLVGGPGQ